MNKSDFASLEQGIIEVGLMMRGELAPAREFPPVRRQHNPSSIVWALCLADEDDALTPGKIYEGHLSPDSKYIGLKDDEGESFLCPTEWFALLNLPQEVTTVLKSVLQKAA